MPIPSDGTTFSHNIKEDGNAIRMTINNINHDVYTLSDLDLG
jgi:hypothetical protein